jgi:hypothetical protein
MDTIRSLVQKCKDNPKNIRFDELRKICEYYFGKNRLKGSHYVYKTPWPGDPRINIQNDNGKAKPYQVRQVIKAIKKLEDIE